MSKVIILLFLTLSISSFLADEDLLLYPEYRRVTNTTPSPDLTTAIPTTTTTSPLVDTTTKTIVRTNSHSIILGRNRFTVRIRRPNSNRTCTRLTVKHKPLPKCRSVQLDNVYNMCITMIILLTFMLFLQCTTCFIPFLLRMLCQRRLCNRPNA